MKLCNLQTLMVAIYVIPQFATLPAYTVKENNKRRDGRESDISSHWDDNVQKEKEVVIKATEQNRPRCKTHNSCISYCHPQNGKCHREGLRLSNRTTDEVKIVSILGDETLEFLGGEIHYKHCLVRTESYPGLSIADAINRLKEFDSQPDILIVHVSANDVAPGVGLSTAFVIHRLKELVDFLRELRDHSRSLEIRVSSILPRADAASSLFNSQSNDINTAVRKYSQRNGLKYVDHFERFRKGANLYGADGKLNEKGMDLVVHSLLDDEVCSGQDKIRKLRKSSLLELKDILPIDQKTYDKHIPPKYKGQATVVYFHVTVLSVDSIDEESMTYVADIFLAQNWKDFRLRLPENMTEDYRILDVDWLKYIWRPDSFFKNAKSVTFHDMSVPNHYLWLYYDKTLLYMAKLTLEMSCAMKFEFYPHDTQLCSMMIESLSHTTDDLIFVWNRTDPLVVNPDIELPQLDIINNTTEDCTLEYSTGNFTCLAVVFNLKRRVGYHLFHTYIPTTLIVVMSWISFWIRPEAIPARVTLGVTSLLTLATQNTQSQSALPPVSYVKAIDVWMSSCTVFVFMSLMEYAVVNHFMGHRDSKKRKKSGDPSVEEPDEKRQFHVKSQKSQAQNSRKRKRQRRCCHLDVAMTIDKFSRIFFPLSFCVLNAIYWITYAIQG